MRPALAILAALLTCGCGLDIQAPDLFLLTRTGGRAGEKLTLLVNDGGTIRCDGGPAHSLPQPLLLSARDLASELNADAKRGMRLPSPPGSVYRYAVRLQNGTVTFPDTAGRRRTELARAELFALQAASQACRLPG